MYSQNQNYITFPPMYWNVGAHVFITPKRTWNIDNVENVENIAPGGGAAKVLRGATELLENLKIHCWPNYSFSQCASLDHHWRAGVTLPPITNQAKPAVADLRERGNPKSSDNYLFFSWPTVIIHYPKTTVESIERTSKKSVSGFLLARVSVSRVFASSSQVIFQALALFLF